MGSSEKAFKAFEFSMLIDESISAVIIDNLDDR
ncbi:predicted protein [Sclerotinia sclerotiorum 1980 UF-70]|uniref:Uncharacterized protein n=1 Tax=Sclerotinia sclerotiorum (strain ATCC 18683 / 1980 / Ss-1) TaxID=665079 RepID=A7EU75_SCLS1|nr:predicted protein [Sclerotinia sclerotiorum 1980 UF-70]EDN93017.1 predicted protein [Sclerotinia sclerotiorum 1980 UF-70]